MPSPDLVDELVRRSPDRRGRRHDHVDGGEHLAECPLAHTPDALRLHVVGTGHEDAPGEDVACVAEVVVPPVAQVAAVVGERLARHRHQAGGGDLPVVRDRDVDDVGTERGQRVDGGVERPPSPRRGR